MEKHELRALDRTIAAHVEWLRGLGILFGTRAVGHAGTLDGNHD
jgi:hypothetical protein